MTPSGDRQDVPDGPDPAIRYRRDLRMRTALVRLWEVREVVLSLVQREVRVRYNQTILGLGWALLAPVSLMVVFSLFLDRVASVETSGVPYPLFSYIGILPWTFFSNAVTTGGNSIVQNLSLLNKVDTPREVFPVASVIVAAIDAAAATLALAALFAIYGRAPEPTTAWALPLIVILVVFTTAGALLVSAVVVYLRDLRHAIAVVLQFGLFATPVIYGLDALPARLADVVRYGNPLAPVIDGLRRAVLEGAAPELAPTAAAALISTVLLLGSYKLFKRLEVGMADVG